MRFSLAAHTCGPACMCRRGLTKLQEQDLESVLVCIHAVLLTCTTSMMSETPAFSTKRMPQSNQPLHKQERQRGQAPLL